MTAVAIRCYMGLFSLHLATPGVSETPEITKTSGTPSVASETSPGQVTISPTTPSKFNQDPGGGVGWFFVIFSNFPIGIYSSFFNLYEQKYMCFP